MEIRATDGFYLPSYFYMKIQSDEDIEECINNNEQTFIHEYIHFLQDLILPYSIRHTLVANRNFALISGTAYKDKRIGRPFSKWDDDSIITRKQNAYTWGGKEFINEKQKILRIEKEYFEINTGAKVYAYILTTNIGVEYHIGARDFLEYIAHKIESRHWTVNHPVFPYETVDLLFEYYGLEWVSDEVKICLVEFSLYNDTPMNQFFIIIEQLVKTNPIFFESYELCKLTLLNLQWNATGGFNETIFSKTERRLRDLSNSLSEKYQNNNFDQIKKWIDLIINFSKNELAGRFIFTELFLMNVDEFRGKITFFIQEIGIPMVFNNKDECISLLPKSFNQNDFIPLYVANKFMHFTSTKETCCPMLSFCKNGSESIINERCTENPISRATEEYLCPFGAFVKSYGLHDIEWNIDK